MKNIGAKYLPLENNTLVHFDSHPDMLLPKDLEPEDAFDKNLEYVPAEYFRGAEEKNFIQTG